MSTVEIAQALLIEERETEAALLLTWSRSLSEHLLTFEAWLNQVTTEKAK